MTKPPVLDQEDSLLSEEAAATKCGVSRTTFRRWAAASCIHPVLVPGAERRKFYRCEDVEAFARPV